MGDEWPIGTLATLARLASGKRPPVVSKDPAPGFHVPVIGGGGVSGFTVEALYDEPILITGRVGTLGKLHVSRGPSWPSDNSIVVLPKDGVDWRFLQYGLQAVVHEAVGMNRGAANPLVTQGDLGRLRIPVPTHPEQEAIGAVLGALDDKIELNQRMGETVEAIAMALFEGWFVDKLALPDWVAQESWSEVPLGELVIEEKQKVDPLQASDEVFEHFSLPAYDTGLGPAFDIGHSIRSTKTRVPKGSILVSRLNPRIPRVWLTDVDSADRAVASTEFLVLTPRASVGRAFAYLTVSSHALQRKLASMATGTSGSHQRVRPAAALAVSVVRPEPAVLQVFCAAVEPLLDRRLCAERENRVLKQLRDALLPKLISGELRIPVAERLVSEVT